MSDPGKTPPPRRSRKGAQALGALATGNAAPIFAQRGFAGADLAIHWPEIVGAGVARFSHPIEMKWPRHGAENGLGATLVVAAHSAFALDLQQMIPVVLERINQRLGWRAIERIAIQQRPFVAEPDRKAEILTPSTEQRAAAGRIAAEIRDDRLREAMTRLGAGALARLGSRSG